MKMSNQAVIISAAVLLFLIAGGYLLARNSQNIFSKTPPPREANLEVPFTPQAPEADWREPWQNACEETSIIMIDSFFKGEGLSKEEASQKILDVFRVKEEVLGESKDESMEEIVEIINRARLGWTASVSVNPELNAIKEEIAAGRPVIAPIDARLLENSPYSEGELDYHVLVISGYNDESEEFIVQDPGTRGGQNSRYGYENFYDAINDFLPDAFPSGRKAVIFTKAD